MSLRKKFLFLRGVPILVTVVQKFLSTKKEVKKAKLRTLFLQYSRSQSLKKKIFFSKNSWRRKMSKCAIDYFFIFLSLSWDFLFRKSHLTEISSRKLFFEILSVVFLGEKEKKSTKIENLNKILFRIHFSKLVRSCSS